jgi:hypothetical protein
MPGTKRVVQIESRARGYALIPADRLDMVSKTVKGLQKAGISFLMEDVDAGIVRELHGAEGTLKSHGVYNDKVKVNITPCTRITWPDPECAL